MLPAMLKGQPKSNRELQERAESYIQSVKKLYEKAEKDSLRAEVELLLKEKKSGWNKHLEQLMQSNEHQEVMQVDNGLIVLKKVYQETSVLSKMTSLEEVQRVYQKTVFYMRRIELDMLEEGWTALLELMEEWELSVEYLIAVLSHGNIYRNLDTGYKLSRIFASNGNMDYAEKLASWIKTQTANGKG